MPSSDENKSPIDKKFDTQLLDELKSSINLARESPGAFSEIDRAKITDLLNELNELQTQLLSEKASLHEQKEELLKRRSRQLEKLDNLQGVLEGSAAAAAVGGGLGVFIGSLVGSLFLLPGVGAIAGALVGAGIRSQTLMKKHKPNPNTSPDTNE